TDPKEIPYATQDVIVHLPPAGTTAQVQVYLNEPPLSAVQPRIQDMELVQLGDSSKLSITGVNFRNAEVIFNQLGKIVTKVPTSNNGTNIVVDLPDGFIAGLTQIAVKHRTAGISNVAYLRPVGGLGAVTTTGYAATFFQTNTNTNEVVRKFVLNGG